MVHGEGCDVDFSCRAISIKLGECPTLSGRADEGPFHPGGHDGGTDGPASEQNPLFCGLLEKVAPYPISPPFLLLRRTTSSRGSDLPEATVTEATEAALGPEAVSSLVHRFPPCIIQLTSFSLLFSSDLMSIYRLLPLKASLQGREVHRVLALTFVEMHVEVLPT